MEEDRADEVELAQSSMGRGTQSSTTNDDPYEEGIYFESYDLGPTGVAAAHGYWVYRTRDADGNKVVKVISFYATRTADGRDKYLGADIDRNAYDGRPYDSYTDPKNGVARDDRDRRRVDFSKTGYSDEEVWSRMVAAAEQIRGPLDNRGRPERWIEYEAVVLLPGRGRAQNSNSGAFTVLRAVGANPEMENAQTVGESEVIPEGVAPRKYVGRGNDLLQNPNIRYLEPQRKGEKDGKSRNAEQVLEPAQQINAFREDETGLIGAGSDRSHRRAVCLGQSDALRVSWTDQRGSIPGFLNQMRQNGNPQERVAAAYAISQMAGPSLPQRLETSPQFDAVLNSLLVPSASPRALSSTPSMGTAIERVAQAKAGLAPLQRQQTEQMASANGSKLADNLGTIPLDLPSLTNSAPFVNEAGAFQLPTEIFPMGVQPGTLIDPRDSRGLRVAVTQQRPRFVPTAR